MIRSTYQCDLCGETFQDYGEADDHTEMHPNKYDMKITSMSEFSAKSGLPSLLEIDWEDDKNHRVVKMQYDLRNFQEVEIPVEGEG